MKQTLTFEVEKRLLDIETGSAEIGKYTVEGEEQTTSVPSDPSEEQYGDYIYNTSGVRYLYDKETGLVTLKPGETITNTSNNAGGELKLLIKTYAITSVESLWSGRPSFKNETDEDIEFYLGVADYYAGDVHTYRIDAELPYYTDADRTKVYLKKGETLTMTSEDVVAYLLNEEGEEIATLSNNTPSITADDDMAFYIAGKGTDEYSFEIAPCAGEELYVSEYEGDSGILQLRHAMGARVKVYGDAGAGYMLIHEMEGKEIVRCVNMSGFNSIKLVSDGEVDECIINEF